MFRTTLAALSLATLSLTPAMADTTWTGTGPRGGTVEGAGSCSADAGTLTCTRTVRRTGPEGQTWTNEATRVATRDGVSVSGTLTGPGGRQATYTRSRTR